MNVATFNVLFFLFTIRDRTTSGITR